MSYGVHDPRKTCVYNSFVYCALPCARGGVPPDCRKCGWNPAVDLARRERLRAKKEEEGRL